MKCYDNWCCDREKRNLDVGTCCVVCNAIHRSRYTLYISIQKPETKANDQFVNS